MSKLKPCPFCGVQLEECTEQRMVSSFNDSRSHSMKSFKAYKHTNCFTEKSCVLSGKVIWADEEGIEAWNTRYEDPCHMLDNGKELYCSECDLRYPYDYDFEGVEYCNCCGSKVVE